MITSVIGVKLLVSNQNIGKYSQNTLQDELSNKFCILV